MTALLYVFLVLCGATVGSFAGNLGLRLAAQRGWAAGRSSCDHCDAALSYTDTLPIVSFVRLRGRCATCSGTIEPAQPFAEILGSTSLPLLVYAEGPLRGALIFLLTMTLLATSVTDLKMGRLPDILSVIAAALCLALVMTDPAQLLIGVIAAILTFGLLEVLRRISARKGRDPGMGFGDVKLAGALALWLGVMTPWALALAAGLGLATVLVRRPAEGRIAFGPFIAGAGLLVGMAGEFAPWLHG